MPREDLSAFAPLLSDGAASVLGAAVLLQALDAEAAGVSTDPYAGIEVHRWRFGGHQLGCDIGLMVRSKTLAGS